MMGNDKKRLAQLLSSALLLAMMAITMTVSSPMSRAQSNRPPAPERIVCAGYEADTVLVVWDEVTWEDGDDTISADSYRVERQIGSDPWETVADDLEDNRYTEKNVDDPPNRRYRVRAYRASDDTYSLPSQVCNGRRVYETAHFRFFYGLRGIDDCANPPGVTTPAGGPAVKEEMCLGNDVDENGVNIHLRRAGEALEGSAVAFARLGFERLVTDHDTLDRIPIYVIWSDGGGRRRGDHIHLAPFTLERRFDPDTRVGDPLTWMFSVHELFHLQQYLYGGLDDPQGNWVKEGQARAVQDKVCLGANLDTCLAFDDTNDGKNDYADYFDAVNTYLGDPDDDPITGQSYHAALFWAYLTEKYGGVPDDPVEEGMGFMVRFWENSAASPGRDGISIINSVLADLGHEARFRDVWQDFAVANYAKNYDGPEKYQYEDMQQPGGNYAKVGLDLNRALAPGDQIVQEDVLHLREWSPRYYEVQPAPNLPLIDIQVIQYSSAPVYYTVLAIKNGEILEEHNVQGRHLQQTLINNDYDRVVLVVASLEQAINYTYSFNGTQPLLKVVAPTRTRVARVGDPAAPGKFRIAVEVLGPDGTPLEGVQAENFSFQVGGRAVAAEHVLTSAPVMGQNWFVVRAPSQETDGAYDLKVSYGNVLSSTERNAVRYVPRDEADNVMVIDRSGSMGEGDNPPLEAAQAAARLYVDSWHPGDTLGLITFDHQVEVEMGLKAWSAYGDRFGSALATGDFNQDGEIDLAIGVPWEGVGSNKSEAGAVNVLYGAASGLTTAGDQIWSQDAPGVAGGSEATDRFGASVTAGDFDGDGYADLAIGVPGESVDGIPGAGAVNVLYGSGDGLAADRDQIWTQNTSGVLEEAQREVAFGRALAAGDFDGDGYADLAIGVPRAEIDGNAAAGAVTLLYGSSNGLTAAGNEFWSQNSSGVGGASRPGDLFGDALAAGDFDGDGNDDLAIGTPGEGVNGDAGAGAVNVLYGTNSGLAAVAFEIWHQDRSGIAGATEVDDAFGSALAAGDFDRDGHDDLAVGVPGEGLPVSGGGETADAGAVGVIYGTSNGLSSTDDQIWHQGSSGIAGLVESGDAFGASVTAGDFDGDGYDDLAAGVPGEAVGVSGDGELEDAGAVNVIYGAVNGLSSTDNQIWSQESEGVLGLTERGDRFGSAVAAGDFDGDGDADLAVGVPDEDVTTLSEGNAGAVNVLYGTSSGVSPANDQIWSQDGDVDGLAEPSSREFALDVIDSLVADGETALGDALQAGWDELVDNAETTRKWAIVLLSDGKETAGTTSFPDVIDDLKEAATDGEKIPAVHSVAVGSEADQPGMQAASLATGGFYQYVALPAGAFNIAAPETPQQSAEDVYFDLAEAHRMVATEVSGRQQFFHFSGPESDTAMDETQTIPVEDGAAELVLSLHWTRFADHTDLLETVLRDPNGDRVQPLLSAESPTAEHVIWRVQNPQGGDWTLKLVSTTDEIFWYVPPYRIQGAVRSEVTMDAHLVTPAEQPVAGLPVTLLAAVTDNGPITDASIVGLIEPQSPSGEPIERQLHDDGQHGDGTAGDGLYGAIYRDTQQDVSYKVSLIADGTSPLSGPFRREATFSFYATAEDGDGDGLPDGWEDHHGTDPQADDADEDPDFDGLTNLGEFEHGSAPLNWDTDGGGAGDFLDVNPNDPANDTIKRTWAVAHPRDARVLVNYAVPQEYARIDIYRGDNGEGPFSHLEGFIGEAITGVYTDTAVTNNESYCYVLVARAYNAQETNTEPTCTTPKADPWPPIGSVEIEDLDGDGAVPSHDVTLLLWATDRVDPENVDPDDDLPPQSSATGVSHVLISHHADFEGAVWQPYAKTVEWQLAQTPTGQATVYVTYRDAAGNESEPASATIRVEEGLSHKVLLPVIMR